MHGPLYLLSLGVQLILKHVEAVVVLQVLCLRVTEHNVATWQAGISAMHLGMYICLTNAAAFSCGFGLTQQEANLEGLTSATCHTARV